MLARKNIVGTHQDKDDWEIEMAVSISRAHIFWWEVEGALLMGKITLEDTQRLGDAWFFVTCREIWA